MTKRFIDDYTHVHQNNEDHEDDQSDKKINHDKMPIVVVVERLDEHIVNAEHRSEHHTDTAQVSKPPLAAKDAKSDFGRSNSHVGSHRSSAGNKSARGAAAGTHKLIFD